MQLEDGTVVRLTQERANQLLMASIGAAAPEDQNYHRWVPHGGACRPRGMTPEGAAEWLPLTWANFTRARSETLGAGALVSPSR